MQIYWCLNADVFQEASVVVFLVWVCFPSMDLLVSAAQSVLYNPDVLLIMSSRATPPKNLPFLIFFNVKVH